MKLHLPIALLTAVICTVSAYGEVKTFGNGVSATYTYGNGENQSSDRPTTGIDNSKYNGHVDVTYQGNFKGIDLGINAMQGHISAIPTNWTHDSKIVDAFQSASATITGEESKASAMYVAPNYYAIMGNKNLTVENGAFVDLIYAGYYHISSGNLIAEGGKQSINHGDAFSSQFNNNYYQKGNSDATIRVVVDNAYATQIYLGSYYSGKVTSQGEVSGDPAWSMNESFELDLNDAKIGYNDGKEPHSMPASDPSLSVIIVGCPSSPAALNNDVSIRIHGESDIVGSISAGPNASNGTGAYAKSITISLEDTSKVSGWIYAGGDGINANTKSYIKGNTKIVLAGGTVDKDVYAGGGAHSVVEGNTEVVIKGKGTNVTGTINGGGDSETSVVRGDKILSFDAASATAIERFVSETKSKNFNAVGFQNMGDVNFDDPKYNRFTTLYVSSKDATSNTTVTTTLSRDEFNKIKKAVVDNKGMLTLTGTNMKTGDSEKAGNLVVKNGGTVSFVPSLASQQVVAADFSAAAAEVRPVVTLASNLELGSGSTLLLNGYVLDLGANDLTVYAGAEIWTIDSAAPATLAMTEEVLSGFITTTGAVAFYDAEGNPVGSVEATVNGQTGTLGYTNGEVTFTAAGGGNVPEPATATLSLLALAGLCARRRRK